MSDNPETSIVQVEANIDAKNLVFGSALPEDVVTRATAVADALAPVIERAKLFVMIRDKKYVRAEGWTTMLSLLGVSPVLEWSHKLDRPGELAYESRIVLTHRSGQIVGAGEAICSSLEPTWRTRDEYAIKSMSQTRAIGKAARLSFSWIISLAGYEPTPAEEMKEEWNKTHTKPKPAPVYKKDDLADIDLIGEASPAHIDAKMSDMKLESLITDCMVELGWDDSHKENYLRKINKGIGLKNAYEWLSAQVKTKKEGAK